MNTNMKTFDFNGFSLTVVEGEDGNPWFVAKDVCKALEIENISQACGRLDDDEKGISKTYTLGGSQELLIINESGLYSMTLASNKPQAKPFKKWVTSEVLPSIRKNGFYIDLENKLTALSPAQVIHNTQMYLNAVKAALPNSKISLSGALTNKIGDARGRPDCDESGALKEALEKFNMPSVLVRHKNKTDPIHIIFDWYQMHKHDPKVAKQLYEKLSEICVGKKCSGIFWNPKAKPFKKEGWQETIWGFETIAEAELMAEKICQVVHQNLPIVLN